MNMYTRGVLMLLIAAALAMSLNQAPKAHPWSDQVIYQIFPRSYRDSNGDGHGDFQGIIQGLDTIKKLGCTAILLNPIYKARVYHNYFADDWFDVDPLFGTLEDFKKLTSEAHKKQIKIILDIEPQYVAEGHEWFQAALKNPDGPEAGYLNKPLPKPGSAPPWYNKVPVRMTTTNLNVPAVHENIEKNLRFWVSEGVDGFRIDHMMDDLDWQGKSKDLYKDLWSPIEDGLKRDFPGTFFVGEQADWESYRSAVEVFEKTPTDAVFNFRLRNALISFKKGIIEKNIEEYKYFTRDGRIQLNFLENHDMIRFASEEKDPVKQRMAAAVLFGVRGIPSLYYGQEIGMQGRQGHWNSDGNDIPVRLGYRWTSTLSAPTPLWYKDTGPWWSLAFSKDHDGRSVEEQVDKPDSLFNWYRHLIEVRRANPALSVGSQDIFETGAEDVLGVKRVAEGETVYVLANYTDKKASVDSPVNVASIDLLTGEKFGAAERINLRPWSVRYIR